MAEVIVSLLVMRSAPRKPPSPTKPTTAAEKTRSATAASKSALKSSSDNAKSSPTSKPKPKHARKGNTTDGDALVQPSMATRHGGGKKNTTVTATATAPVTTTTTTTSAARTTTATAAEQPTCDWSKRPGSRVCFSVYGYDTLVPCCVKNCNVTLHHGCQAMWEYDHDAEADGCLKLCKKHHPHYRRVERETAAAAAAEAAAVAVTTGTMAEMAAVAGVTTTLATAAKAAMVEPTSATEATAAKSTAATATNAAMAGGETAAAAATPIPSTSIAGRAAGAASSTTPATVLPPPTQLINMMNPSPAASDLTGAAAVAAAIIPTLPSFNIGQQGLLLSAAGDSNTDDVDDDCDESSPLSADGGDSDEEGEEAMLHTAPDDVEEESDDDGMEDDGECGDHTTTLAADGQRAIVLKGSPPGWLPPQPPENFTYVPKHGAPAEEDIDNPGGWPLYSFVPRYVKDKYIGHYTPTGAQVAPPNSDGSRVVDGWQFHYNGWKHNVFDAKTYTRMGATPGNLKPLSRAGCLDVDVLKRHGLTAIRVRDDPLFFFQMLFPIMSPSESGVDRDHRMPFFFNVAMLTNLYASSKGGGIGIGNDWKPCSVKELVRWTAVPIRHGALEGSPGMLRYRWNQGDARFDPVISDGIERRRWLDIKRYFKLNMNYEERPRGSDGYDPCTKFDYIFKCLVHNMNNVTARADLDQTIDESTWGFAGFSAEAGGRLLNKPVSKGKYRC